VVIAVQSFSAGIVGSCVAFPGKRSNFADLGKRTIVLSRRRHVRTRPVLGAVQGGGAWERIDSSTIGLDVGGVGRVASV
jgi:hypothetical protein